ncbi:hypothetical protein [Bacillus sp. ISTL8]|uniref:hypothetical protein n=1 Tax=Bacillus sp. ISTL8 TaxID=2596896 RepID=UPI00145679AB|nr:hypothetical protein [Bacillus sp. ISTL8]
MVEMLKINYEESVRVHKENLRRIEKKMCYNNVFNVVSYVDDKFHSGEWRVAYGYWTAIDGIMARHCYIVDKDNRVIDPTAPFSTTKDIRNVDYLTFKIFEDADEYLELLWEHDREPALYKAFLEEEKKAHEHAMKNNLILIQ